MNPRVTKEFRPLLLPWCLAALAAAGYLVALGNPLLATGEFGSFLNGLAGVAFVAGVLVLSALPMGFEVHDRTLLLLFSQPADRTELWKEKLRAAAISVSALTIVHGVVSAATGHLERHEALVYAVFAVTAICSVGYHTLAARSVMVGIASAVATPFGIALSVHLFVYYVLGLEVQLSDKETIALIAIGCAAYSAFSLWFGRRQFTTLELKDTAVPRGAQIPEALVPRKLTDFFRAQPTGAVVNLIRKEVCLQRPIFLVSAIFTVCWLLTLLLMVLRPAWHGDLVAVFHGLTGTQIVLMVILTGCVSLGDDKALGTAGWHLALPISARRQWLIKLLAAAATAVATVVVLPTLLAALTLFKARVGLLALDDPLRFVIPCAVIFVVSFWSGSMVANTVRGALTCMVALGGIAACVAFGARVPEAFFFSSPQNSPGLQSGLITSLVARYQLPPNFFAEHDGTIAYSIMLVVLIVAVTMLAQSLAQFRRAQTQRAVLLKYSVILAVMALAGSFWCADLMRSINQQWDSPLVAEVTGALRSVSLQDSELSEGRVRKLTPQDVEAKIPLSDRAKLWLRNTTIDVHWSTQVRWDVRYRRYGNEKRSYIGELHLPNGATVPLHWTAPDPESNPQPKK